MTKTEKEIPVQYIIIPHNDSVFTVFSLVYKKGGMFSPSNYREFKNFVGESDTWEGANRIIETLKKWEL